MKVKIESITISLSRKEGEELRGQILKLAGKDNGMGGMNLCVGELKDTPIAQLFDLLSGNFEQQTKGVNFL